jgi:hypothetical protein
LRSLATGCNKQIMKKKGLILLFSVLLLVSCDHDKEIRHLLNSLIPNEIIDGAYKAGETADEQYVPLLLKNAADGREGTSLHLALLTVYSVKMFALERILHVSPPHTFWKIKTPPDSVNIKFYTALWQQMNRRK